MKQLDDSGDLFVAPMLCCVAHSQSTIMTKERKECLMIMTCVLFFFCEHVFFEDISDNWEQTQYHNKDC